MKIKLVQQTFGRNISYKYLEFGYCCEKLHHNPMIGLFREYEVLRQFCGTCEHSTDMDSEPCSTCKIVVPGTEEAHDLLPRVMIHRGEDVNEWGEIVHYEYYFTIHYCPHCGEKIELEVVGTEDITEKYNSIVQDRAKLWKLCQTTDSKNLGAELLKQVERLDSLIKDIHELGKFDENYHVYGPKRNY